MSNIKLRTAAGGSVTLTPEDVAGDVTLTVPGDNSTLVSAADLSASTGAGGVGYLPAGTGTVTTTVQEKLRETISVKDFGAKGDWNGAAGTDDTASIVTAISLFDNIKFTTGSYYIADTCSVVIGSNKTITFEPGVKIVCGSNPLSAKNVFNFSGVADSFKIVGNGVEIFYASTPTVRTNHAISITGASITNLEISGVNILNAANMGIAVFCGDLNTVASGSKNISIHDCQVKNTLGDGVHVENADSDVKVYNIYGENNHDDVVAVINYTGTGSAATHPSATTNVAITNINATGVRTSTISLAGVENFCVNGVTEYAYSSASVITLKLTHAAGYTVGNRFGVLDNIATDGATKIVTLDTPSGGTAYNTYLRFGKIVGLNIKNYALSLSNAGTSGDNKLKNIEFDNVGVVGSGSSAAPAYISQTSNVRINNLHGDTFAAGLLAANNDYFSWGRIRFQGFQSGTSYALNVNTNTNIRPGQLDVNAGNCTSGLIFQSNNGVTHNGLWQVANASANYTFGSNLNVIGAFDVITATSYRASVTAGTTEDIVYERVVPSGAKYVPTVTVASNDGLRWGVKNMLNDKLTMVWTDSQSVVFVTYSISVSAA